MLCQNCNKRVAKIHFTKVVNDERIDTHLCEMCAQENMEFGYDNPFSINNFLMGLLDIPMGYSINGSKIDHHDIYKCNECGLAFEEFKHNGRLGCVQCYNTFKDNLVPIMKRLHGSIHHSGKLPQRVGGVLKVKREIEKLKKQLTKAIKEEEFEKAAQLRDKIRELENCENS